MSSPSTNIFRNRIVPVVVGCTGVGTSSSYIFQKVFENSGAPGTLQLGLQNVVGVFSVLQFNLEWSPTNGSGTYFETVATWNPLSTGVGFFPIGESGFYRLNCTSFTGGTSVDIAATVCLSGSVVTSAGPSANVTLVGSTITLPVSIAGTVSVTQGTSPWVTSFSAPQHVIVDSGGGGGTQYTDETNETAGAFTGTAALGYNGTQVVALRMDASNNLLTKVNVALPAGTNVIGHVIADSGSTTAVTGNVTVVQGTGTNLHTVIDSGTLTTVSAVTAITNPLPAGTNVIGHVITDTGSTTAVTGTVATNADGSASGGTAATASILGGGIYNSSAPTLTTGEQASLQLDSSGNLKTTTLGNIIQWNSTNLGRPSNYGTSPGAVEVIGVNAYITNTPAVTLASTTITGSVAVTGTFWQATQPISGAVSFTAPQHVIIDSATLGTVTVSGTVTANIGTTNGLALDATVSGLQVAQNSTTSGQSGSLVQGAVTTAAPSYTTAKTSPLSLTTAGALRTDASATTQPISGAVSFTAPQHVIVDSATLGTVTVSGTVTANIGTTNGLALDSSVNGLLVAQASTTSGQSGPLVQTATTTAAPTYTTAKTNPLSTDTSGNLRTSVNNTVTVSGTVTSNIGTTNGLALDATLTGGTAKTLVYDGTNTIFTSTHPGYVQFGSAQAVTLTSTTVTGSVAVTGTFWQSTQPVSIAATVVSEIIPVNDTNGYSTKISQALTTSAQIKSSAGKFHGFDYGNPNASPAWVFVYNTTSAPTIGSTTNLVYQKFIPTGAGSNIEIVGGIYCSAGIYVAVSAAASSSSAPSTGLTLTTLYI